MLEVEKLLSALPSFSLIEVLASNKDGEGKAFPMLLYKTETDFWELCSIFECRCQKYQVTSVTTKGESGSRSISLKEMNHTLEAVSYYHVL